jgi:hypothetical protein
MFVYSFFALPLDGSSVHKYSRIHGSPPLFVWGWVGSDAVAVHGQSLLWTYIHITKSRQDICMGVTQQRSMTSQLSCPKRCGVWTSSCVYIHGFTEPMRVLILLANLWVLIWPAKVCVLFLLANLCTHFSHYHGRVRLSTNILVYTDHPHFLFGGGVGSDAVAVNGPSLLWTYVHITKSRQDICIGATQQRSMSSQWSCPKRCGVWTSLQMFAREIYVWERE